MNRYYTNRETGLLLVNPQTGEPLTVAEVRDRMAEAMADDAEAERAYQEYIDGLDERLADRFPEAF